MGESGHLISLKITIQPQVKPQDTGTIAEDYHISISWVCLKDFLPPNIFLGFSLGAGVS